MDAANQDKIVHSIHDFEVNRKEGAQKKQAQKAPHLYDKHIDEVDDEDVPSNHERHARLFEKALNHLHRHTSSKHFDSPMHLANGVISSGDDDENEEFEDDDEDEIVGEDKRLLEDIKLTAEDIVIVASFKLPIQVARDAATGEWKVLPSRSMLYPTLFKLREKKKMVKIVCIGWPGIVPQNE